MKLLDRLPIPADRAPLRFGDRYITIHENLSHNRAPGLRVAGQLDLDADHPPRGLDRQDVGVPASEYDLPPHND
jgi:hypothetical protein